MEEALALESLDPALPAARIIGRRELLGLHDSTLSEAEAIAKAVIARAGTYEEEGSIKIPGVARCIAGTK